MHVSLSSPVADHCSAYALSDEKEPLFSSPCDHDHDNACSQCEELKTTMSDVQRYLEREDLGLPDEELDDLRHTTEQAAQNVLSWKAHQLRSKRQDMARIDVLDQLDESSVMITQDWAMKFLPQKYRESQTDWFAKRGISWHISVVARKHYGKLQSQSFVHIVENCNQDSSVVIRIMEHILRTLKKENPKLTAAFFRQDNAGCYHSSIMLAACRSMGAVTGISVSRIDFSDPQGGKGPCDRKAATIKAHVRRFINEGHDVQTPRDLEAAMLSAGGLSGIRVAVVDSLGVKDSPIKWDGISLINNLQYAGTTITVWRSYDVGSGKMIDKQLPQGMGMEYLEEQSVTRPCMSYLRFSFFVVRRKTTQL